MENLAFWIIMFLIVVGGVYVIVAPFISDFRGSRIPVFTKHERK